MGGEIADRGSQELDTIRVEILFARAAGRVAELGCGWVMAPTWVRTLLNAALGRAFLCGFSEISIRSVSSIHGMSNADIFG